MGLVEFSADTLQGFWDLINDMDRKKKKKKFAERSDAHLSITNSAGVTLVGGTIATSRRASGVCLLARFQYSLFRLQPYLSDLWFLVCLLHGSPPSMST